MQFRFGFDDLSETDDVLVTANVEEPATTSMRPIEHLDFLQALDRLPSRISYSSVSLLGSHRVLKRDLYDARFQTALEEEDQSSAALPDHDSDLIKGQYEGGFKTWECSVDLSNYVLDRIDQLLNTDPAVFEIGCGSALPTCVTIKALFERLKRSKTCDKATFHLLDYNREVLELITVPNLFLAYLDATRDLPSEGELEIDDQDVNEFKTFMATYEVKIELFYGDWSAYKQTHQFLADYNLILSSETIYDASTLPSLVDILKDKMQQHCLIAAKSIYFGLTGGVVEFCQAVDKVGGQVTIHRTETNSVERAVLSIRFR